jgi:hypothetical protein
MNRPSLQRYNSTFLRPPTLRRLQAGGLMVLCLALMSGAEPAASSSPRFSDVVLARSALAALDQVPELRGINLVVSVVDGIAVIGGPVPSQAHAQRAEQAVRAVPGIRDVRNTCFVSQGPDPLLRAVTDKSWTEQQPRSWEVPGVWERQPPVSPFPLHSVARGPDTNKTVIVRRPAETLPGGREVLGAPVPPQSPSDPPTRDVPLVAPGTLTATGRDGPLTIARQLQRSDPRFAQVHIEFREHTLWISGSIRQAEDAWELAARLRQIPGVQRVVVGKLQLTR